MTFLVPCTLHPGYQTDWLCWEPSYELQFYCASERLPDQHSAKINNSACKYKQTNVLNQIPANINPAWRLWSVNSTVFKQCLTLYLVCILLRSSTFQWNQGWPSCDLDTVTPNDPARANVLGFSLFSLSSISSYKC